MNYDNFVFSQTDKSNNLVPINKKLYVSKIYEFILSIKKNHTAKLGSSYQKQIDFIKTTSTIKVFSY